MMMMVVTVMMVMIMMVLMMMMMVMMMVVIMMMMIMMMMMMTIMMMMMVMMMVVIMMMMMMMTTTTIMILRTIMEMNVLHFPTADVTAFNDDQDDETIDVSEYGVEIRAGLSTGTRHFSLHLLQLIKDTFQGVCFRFWPIIGEAFFWI